MTKSTDSVNFVTGMAAAAGNAVAGNRVAALPLFWLQPKEEKDRLVLVSLEATDGQSIFGGAIALTTLELGDPSFARGVLRQEWAPNHPTVCGRAMFTDPVHTRSMLVDASRWFFGASRFRDPVYLPNGHEMAVLVEQYFGLRAELMIEARLDTDKVRTPYDLFLVQLFREVADFSEAHRPWAVAGSVPGVRCDVRKPPLGRRQKLSYDVLAWPDAECEAQGELWRSQAANEGSSEEVADAR